MPKGICDICDCLVLATQPHEWDEDHDKCAHTRCIDIARETAAEARAEAREDYRRGF